MQLATCSLDQSMLWGNRPACAEICSDGVEFIISLLKVCASVRPPSQVSLLKVNTKFRACNFQNCNFTAALDFHCVSLFNMFQISA